jgi:hypothetical protein
VEDADISRSWFLEQLVGQDHEAYERLTQLATSAELGPGEFLERVLLLGSDPYELSYWRRLTNMAKQAVCQRLRDGRATEAQFLEHLILRAEVIWNFQPTVLPPPRPWWKLWSKEEREPELPAIVADLRGTPTR